MTLTSRNLQSIQGFFKSQTMMYALLRKPPWPQVALGRMTISFVTQIETVLKVKGSTITNDLGKPGIN